MTDGFKSGLRHHVAAMARDVMTIGALLGMVGSSAWFVFGDELKPYVQLPSKVESLHDDLEGLRTVLTPEFIHFMGRAVVIKPDQQHVQAGGAVRLAYVLARQVSCDSLVEPLFINVATGVQWPGPTYRAIKAPVTSSPIWFVVPVPVPENLPEGDYVFFPRLTPLDCGIYGPIRPPASDVFHVAAGG